MIPPKRSVYRSWSSLKDFMGDQERRQLGSRAALETSHGWIVLTYGGHGIMSFSEHDGINIFRPTFKNKIKWAELANPILAGFGWNYGEITFGPHKKYWRGLKPLNVTPGSPESDYRSLVPNQRRDTVMYAMDWKGKITKHGGKLSEYQIKRALISYENRAEASRRVRQCAYILGFPNTAKMNGFKLPKDKSPETAATMNALAQCYGFAHVAHAWANGFLVPSDPNEIEMLQAGMIHLMANEKDPQRGISLYEQSNKLWLRQRPIAGEDLDRVSNW